MDAAATRLCADAAARADGRRCGRHAAHAAAGARLVARLPASAPAAPRTGARGGELTYFPVCRRTRAAARRLDGADGTAEASPDRRLGGQLYLRRDRHARA